jgi:hypothetical protein
MKRLPIWAVWIFRIGAAGILAQTLYFKFTAAPESVYIFTKMGAEPYGRLGSGLFEMISAGLLLTPALTVFGAFLALGVMTGAIVSHLTVLGVEILGDGGLLFGLACTVWLFSAILLWDDRETVKKYARCVRS